MTVKLAPGPESVLVAVSTEYHLSLNLYIFNLYVDIGIVIGVRPSGYGAVFPSRSCF